ncbi:hypothetical protein AAG906_025752 [Vitis piasezkii]
MKKADQDLCSNQAQTILQHPRIFIPNPLTNHSSSSPSLSPPSSFPSPSSSSNLNPSNLSSSEQDSDEPNKRPPSNRRPRLRKVETATFSSPVATSVEGDNGLARVEKRSEVAAEESDWVDGDVEILKKQLLKHPAGMPGRWEAVAEAFQGRHGVESVIRKAKSLGERKLSDSDSFNRFLKDRKPWINALKMQWQWNTVKRWSSGEDIALLNALKAFPKDVPIRWEKIAAAVPGRSKAACMKRFSELKRIFGTPRLLLRSNCVEEEDSLLLVQLGKSVGCMAGFEVEGSDLLGD